MKSKGNFQRPVYLNGCLTTLGFNSYPESSWLFFQYHLQYISARVSWGRVSLYIFFHREGPFLPSPFKNYSSRFTQVNSYINQTWFENIGTLTCNPAVIYYLWKKKKHYELDSWTHLLCAQHNWDGFQNWILLHTPFWKVTDISFYYCWLWFCRCSCSFKTVQKH